MGQDLSTLGASDCLTWLGCCGGAVRGLEQELELVGLLVLESEVEIARVLLHQSTVESVVEFQLVDKSIIWAGLRSRPRQQLQHGGERGTSASV